MLKIVLPFFILAFFCCSARNTWAGNDGKDKDAVKGKPAFYKSTVAVDGHADEWESGLFYYHSDAGILYALANDSMAFYICMKVLSGEQQMKILRNGLEIWIDPSGKKKKISGITCPLSSPRLGNQNFLLKQGEKPDQQKMALQSVLLVKEMTLTGFKDEIDGTRHMDYNATGIKVVLAIDSTGVLVYEAKIPFSAFRNEIKPAQAISLGCVIPAIDVPPEFRNGMSGGAAEGGRHGGGRPGGGGKPGGGMPGGGAPGGEMGGRPDAGGMQHLNKETSFWHKAGLAQPEKTR